MSETASRTSVILKEIIEYPSQDTHVTVGEFIGMLGDKGFCLAILIFSLPNSLPVPGIPGFSTLTGLPITFIGLQMVIGRQSLWLPYRFASKKFSRSGLVKMLSKALPAVVWLEKFLRPRWLPLTEPLADRFIGAMFVVLSLIIALPIPGGNFLPGLAMSLIALAMLERDGIFLVAALAFAVSGIVFMYKIILLFFYAVGKAFETVF